MATEFISNSWLMPTNANAESNRVSNYSLDFDSASSQSIQITDNNNIDLNNIDFSISFWMKPNATQNQLLLQKYTGGNGWAIYAFGTSGIHFYDGAFFQLDSNAPANNVWSHYTITASISEGKYKIYLNGVLQNTVSKAVSITATTSPLYLASQNGTAFFYDGKMTEVSIFDYALSASQVLELYGTGSAIGNPMAITNGRKPVAYYPLGNSAFNSEFLTPNGAEQDYVFDFDGTTQKINIGNISSLNNASTFTISMWINFDDFTVDNAFFGAYNSYTNWLSIKKAAGNPGNFYFILANGANKNAYIPVSGNLETGKWYNLIYVYDGSGVSDSEKLKLYLNGSQKTLSFTGPLPSTTYNFTEDYFIGNDGTITEGNGQISNAAIFNTALPATGTESVESLYNYGTPPNIASYSGLQAWYELDASATFDGSNWSIPDASSNSNTGTSSGMTAANLVQSDLIINQSYDPFSLSFDGTDDDVTISNVNLGATHTISLWMKSDGTDRTDMICNAYGASRIYGPAPTVLFYYANNNYAYWLNNTGGNIDLNDDNWHHMCFVRNGTSIDFYADGVLQTISVNNITATDEYQFTNFMHPPATSRYTKGTISNLSVYSTNISSAQVKTLYNEHKPFDLNTFAVTPVSWWRLGAVNSSFDGTNWTVLDEIGTSNGTSANMTQADLVDGVGATGSGTSSGMSSGTNRTGDAPYSDNNAVSYNMSVLAKSSSTPT